VDSGLRSYYLRPEILEALYSQADGREIWLGKGSPRPLAAESREELRGLIERYGSELPFPFFFSVEVFREPLRVGVEPAESQRLDWAFFLDLDSEDFEAARRAAAKGLKILEAFNVDAFLLKFSGRRGFHFLIPGLAFDIFGPSEYVKGYPLIPLRLAAFFEACIRDPRVKIDYSVYKPRQLYRAAYSLHEATGLVSIPIEDPLAFRLEDARPENVSPRLDWLPKPRVGEARRLLEAVRDWWRRRPPASGLKILKPGTSRPSDGRYGWVEALLSRGIPDGRHRLLWLVVAPYLVNIKGFSVEEASARTMEWLARCGEIRPLDGDFEDLSRYYCEYAARTGLKPLSLRRLREEPEYRELFKLLEPIVGSPFRLRLRGEAGLKLLKIDGEPPVYEIEEAVIGEARGIYNQLISTFKGYPESMHWKRDEEKNLLLGWVGEKIVDMILNQYNIQHVWNHPIIQDIKIRRKERALPDFYVGDMSLDVKVKTKKNPLEFYVNRRRWEKHQSNIIIFIGVDDEIKEGVIYGWISDEELKKCDVKNPGHSEAFIIKREMLHPINKLFDLLKK
jgi:hypothetical protein